MPAKPPARRTAATSSVALNDRRSFSFAPKNPPKQNVMMDSVNTRRMLSRSHPNSCPIALEKFDHE